MFLLHNSIVYIKFVLYLQGNREVEQWQLVWLITKRTEVRILPSQHEELHILFLIHLARVAIPGLF